MIKVSVQPEDFDPGMELATLAALGGGGVASFTGLVRGGDGLTAMTLDHYPGMTQAALKAVADTAMARWPLLGVTVIHRVRRLAVGDRIVFVATASAHRLAALDSCAFLIDRLKTDAPFWKQEHRAEGDAWVAARESDGEAAERWG
jgi:molybdopterin synthase catalytic subunit